MDTGKTYYDLTRERDDALARVEELEKPLLELASLAPHYPMAKRYGNRPTMGDIYRVSSGECEEGFITVEGVNEASRVLSLPTTGTADRIRVEELQEIIESVKSKKIGINKHDDYSDLLHDALCNDIITSIRSRIEEIEK
jgi:hypothetical protein